MSSITAKDVKEVTINKDGIKIIQNNGGMISLDRKQILDIVEEWIPLNITSFNNNNFKDRSDIEGIFLHNNRI